MRLPWQKNYHTLNRILIDESALRSNLALYRDALPGVAICPVLKSNAYGHGLALTAQILDSENCPFLIVDSLYEAYELKKVHIKTPILILGYNFEENLHKRLPFHFTATDLRSLEVLHAKRLPIHLEINTGMNRMGFAWDTFDETLAFLLKHKIHPEGIFTHLSSADDADNEFTELQLSRFLKILASFNQAGLKPKWVHVGNSAGALKTQHPEINMVRLGLGLYGINPYSSEDSLSPQLSTLEPVLEFRSTLVDVQSIKKGERSGYGQNYTAPHDEIIGVVAAGYYEGVPISLSNKGQAEVNGTLCPMIGRVCMNHTMISLKGVNASVGDEVILYSSGKKSPLNVATEAKAAGTIPYELLARLSQSVRRQLQ